MGKKDGERKGISLAERDGCGNNKMEGEAGDGERERW